MTDKILKIAFDKETDPHIEAAGKIFEKTKNSLMAHTIRAVNKEFIHNQLDVNIVVVPIDEQHDPVRYKKMCQKKNVSNLLSYKISQQNNKKLAIQATICIRYDANHHLARFCIAHELYHLLLQLNEYKRLKDWPESKELSEYEENACDAFAWHLCLRHNQFYLSNEVNEQCIFTKGKFPDLIKTKKFEDETAWPFPFKIDKNDSFIKKMKRNAY